ncbi:MAG: hypothetical protein QME96_12000, partial [Myxococcota bacterium]|nr:hypothetical protein [Myxococcota bacterium]
MTARTCPLCERLRRADVRHWGAAWAVVTVAASWLVGSWVSLEPADPPPVAEVRRAMDVLRAAAEGSGAPVAPAADGTTLHGPVRVVLWHDGMPVFRREFDATTMDDLVARASKEIDDARSAGRFARVDMSRARLHLSFVVAEGPVLAWPPLAAAASFVTTLDGAALRAGDATARLWPDDLLRRRLYSAFLPLPGGVMKAGLDVPRAVEALWAPAGHPDERRGVLRRF